MNTKFMQFQTLLTTVIAYLRHLHSSEKQQKKKLPLRRRNRESELCSVDAHDKLREGIAKIKANKQGVVQGGERDYLDNVREATLPDGSVDLLRFDSHRTGRVNGGVACDVTSGPCRCGAWH